jgi:hypothetical protein
MNISKNKTQTAETAMDKGFENISLSSSILQFELEGPTDQINRSGIWKVTSV